MMISRHEDDNGQAVKGSIGDVFEIVLPENPTTGFRWRLEKRGEPVSELVSDHFVAPQHVVPGRGGVHHWEFRLEQAGTATISLALGRSWQASGAESRKFQIDVHVPAK